MNPKKSYMPELIENLPSKSLKQIQKLCAKLKASGFECFMVGGAVRDLLLKQPTQDIDFATNAHPKHVQEVFSRTIPTGIKHGTITVRLEGRSFEVTTYRSDGKYKDARRPDKIRFASSLSADLSRRDFTINALAYDPLTAELVDEHGGLADLSKKSIRTVGKPEKRFYEDGLRPVRACRFAATLDFTLEPKTYRALQEPLIQKRVSQIAVERFSAELWKGFSARKVSRMIDLLEKSGLLFLFLPETQIKKYTSKEDLIRLDDLYPALPTLRMAYWLWRLRRSSTEQLGQWSQSLKLSGKQTKNLKYYCSYFDFQQKVQQQTEYLNISQAFEQREFRYQIRKFLSQLKQSYGEDSSDFIKSTKPYFANAIATDTLLNIYAHSPLVIKDLHISGKELMALGFRKRQIGAALTEFLDQVLRQPELNHEQSLLQKAKDIQKNMPLADS